MIDRLPDLQRAAFSSAAMPMAAVQEFGLPAQVVGALDGLELVGTQRPVARLQQPSLWGWCWICSAAQLAERTTTTWGGRLQLGWTASAVNQRRMVG